MSGEPVEQFIRRMYDRWNAEGIGSMADEFFNDDVSYHDDSAWPGGSAHNGRTAVIARFEEVIATLGLREAVVERVVDAGGQVAWIIVTKGRSSAANVPNEHRWGYVGRIADGKLAYFRAYYDAEEALKAVGLVEEAMSENLDLVRSIYADWERGDFGSADWADPAIEYLLPDAPEGGSWAGRSGMAQAHREFLSAWGGWQVVADEYREVDAERVLVPFRFSARGKRSGLEVEQAWGQGATVFTLRDGKVVKLANYFRRDHALADLGLAG